MLEYLIPEFIEILRVGDERLERTIMLYCREDKYNAGMVVYWLNGVENSLKIYLINLLNVFIDFWKNKYKI